jgi:hypothetical protein
MRDKKIMKMLNIAVAAAILAAAAPFARAEGIDFDGKTSKAASFTETMKSSGIQPAAVQAPEKVKLQLPADQQGGIEIAMTIRRGGAVYEDKLLCLKGDDGAAVKECRKDSDGLELTKADVEAFGVDRFLTAKEPTFAGLIEKSRYCHDVVEECDRWKTVKEKVCVEYAEDSHGHQGKCIGYEIQYFEECSHYTHYCND